MFMQEAQYHEITCEKEVGDQYIVFIQPPPPHKFFYMYAKSVSSDTRENAVYLQLWGGKGVNAKFIGIVSYYLAFEIHQLTPHTQTEVLALFQKWHEEGKPLVKGIEDMDKDSPKSDAPFRLVSVPINGVASDKEESKDLIGHYL